MKFSIKLLYLYLFSFIGLLTTIIGAVQLVDLGLRTYVFKEAEYYDYARPVAVGEKSGEIDEEREMELQKKNATSQKQRPESQTIMKKLLLADRPY